MNPYSVIGALILGILLGLGGYAAGWQQRGEHEASIALEAKRAADQELKKERDRADVLSHDLELEKQNIKTVTIEVVKKIPKVTTVYVEVPGETPKNIPPAIYTFGAVSLYNHALRPDLPETASEFAYPPGATSITRAKIDTDDVLNVHAINAGRYADCRAQLNKLIDFYEDKEKAP